MSTPEPRTGSPPAGPAPPAPAPLPTGRGIELVLLAFAAVLVTGALALVEANQEQELTQALLWVGLAYLALFAIAHLAVRRFAPYADPLILPCVALLNGLGLVMIHRLDLARVQPALAAGDDAPAELLSRQVAWTAIGLALFVAVLWVVRDHRTIARYAYTAGFLGLVLLALPGLLPSSISEVNGAKLWIRVGSVGIQPGEFAKILLIVFFAAFLVQKRELFSTAGRRFLGMELPRARDLAPLIVAWGLSVGVLVLERDLGTSLLFFGIVLVLLYVATERVSWMLIGLSFFFGGCFIAYQLFGHVRVRVQVWLDPFSDYDEHRLPDRAGPVRARHRRCRGHRARCRPAGPGAVRQQRLHALLARRGARASSGWPRSSSCTWCSSHAACAAPSPCATASASCSPRGWRSRLALQVFIVIGGATKLIPLTGLTLPFLSYGGSSLRGQLRLVALLLRISNAARAPLPRRPAESRSRRSPRPAHELVERPS